MCWGGESVVKKKLVFNMLVWNYFDYPEETWVIREREAIYPEKRFHRLRWDMITRDVGKHKGRVER